MVTRTVINTPVTQVSTSYQVVGGNFVKDKTTLNSEDQIREFDY